MQVKSDWLDSAEDIQHCDFMAAAVRLETIRILLPGTIVRCGILVSMYIIGMWDLPGDAFLFLSLPQCYGAIA